jgi:hypothetical protein
VQSMQRWMNTSGNVYNSKRAVVKGLKPNDQRETSCPTGSDDPLERGDMASKTCRTRLGGTRDDGTCHC